MSKQQRKILITSDQIQTKINQLAKEIAGDYQDKNLLVIGILKGSFIFLADFSRALWQAGCHDFHVDFIEVQSYGSSTESSRDPVITFDPETKIKDRHILLVDDIVDTGHSLKVLYGLLEKRRPKSLETLALLSKPSRREVEVKVKYIGFEVSGWIEGYGLDDTEGKSRGRPDIIEIIQSE